MKFHHSLSILNKELSDLWNMGKEFPSDLFEKSNIYKKIGEVKAAIRLLEGYDFKLKE